MLQIDHIYEFLYHELFYNTEIWHLKNGLPYVNNPNMGDIAVFTPGSAAKGKILFFDQEPCLWSTLLPYLKIFSQEDQPKILITSEKSQLVAQCCQHLGIKPMHYFFHGFAAIDWYRGYQVLNHNKSVYRSYAQDYISFNRIVTGDRSYRIYLINLLQTY